MYNIFYIFKQSILKANKYKKIKVDIKYQLKLIY